MATNLSINNVITVSVSQPGVGLGRYNTSNLALFTDETPAASFGLLGYKLYLDPVQVEIDFGTGSKTFAQAVSVFSQQPNILGGGGYLCVIPLLQGLPAITAVQHIDFATLPTAGQFVLNFAATPTTAILFSDNAATIQGYIQTLPGLGSATVTGNFTTGFDVTFTGFVGPAPLLTVTGNTLTDVALAPVVVTVTTTTVGQAAGQETLVAAIARTVSLIEYFGIIEDYIVSQVDMLDAAAFVQALSKIIFFVTRDPATYAPGGQLDLLRSGGFSQSRGLFYGSDNDDDAIVMMAAYAGRGLSVDFEGSNTTITMHLKDLIGIQPDPTLDQTGLNGCQLAGADVYISIQGVAKTFTSGQNTFFDDVYNLLWIVGAIKVAGFNVLAETSTKIVQTENGVSTLKAAFRQVCEQAVANQFLAPNPWTSPNTFGNQADFLANILQRGYYIYSTPISQQSPVARAAREAPLVQIAIKYAGAIHRADVIVNINK